jgi:hypothetical protein
MMVLASGFLFSLRFIFEFCTVSQRGYIPMWRLKKGFNAVEYDNITMIKHIENDYSTKNRELIPDVLIAATKAYNYSWKMRG